jgi:uncharacterized lipoprotein YddW (UPF0748 family)
VDGINLDYIRTMGVCRCEYCRTEYHRKHGRDLAADIGAVGTHDPFPSHLQNWVDEAVESIVRGTAAQAKSLKSEIVISVDGHPTPAPSREGRQEIRWANAGLVDVVYDMEYSWPPNFENHYLMMAGFSERNKLILLLPNLYFVNRRPIPIDGKRLWRMVKYARQRMGVGYGLYLYSMLNEDQLKELSQVF